MSSMTERDWYTWHRRYDQPDSGLARRLAAVQEQIRRALEAVPPGPLHAVSLCAGQGRDLIGVLARHRRREDVTAPDRVACLPRGRLFARPAPERPGPPAPRSPTPARRARPAGRFPAAGP